jgi:bacterioferritin-associated ferredoxin
VIVCSCNVISDADIKSCLISGSSCPRTASGVYACLGCRPQCGKCARTIRGIVASVLGEQNVAGAACATSCAVIAAALSDETTAVPRKDREAA